MKIKNIKSPFVAISVIMITTFGAATNTESAEGDLPECCKTAPMQCSETELLKCNTLSSCQVAEKAPQGCEDLDVWRAPQEHKDMSLYIFKKPVFFLETNDLSIFYDHDPRRGNDWPKYKLKKVATFVCPRMASYFRNTFIPKNEHHWIYFCAADADGNPLNWTRGIPIDGSPVGDSGSVGGFPLNPLRRRAHDFVISPPSDSAIVKNVSPQRHFPSSSIQLYETRLAYCRSETLRRKLECDVNKLKLEIAALASQVKKVDEE
ncbi:MAG: hypothetical protein N0E44_02605 [Candidatus Thiodiazotropha lotti]|nr:hypothetical protein [Candidatus Thiodiazotropha lotti]MCW4218767.1 hypothetical protein [Candidatus Thiodiazotropha lotti]